MAITKKQATKIAKLINSITVWNTAVKDAIHNGERASQYMAWHNEYATELNTILGMEAVTLYKQSNGEAY